MNTEIILAVVIAVVCLVEIALIIYAIRSTNKRLSELESIPPFEPKATEYLSVRLSVLEKWMQSQQPPTEHPEVKGGYANGATTYEPTYYPLWIQSEEFKRLLVIQSNPEVKYWFKNKEVTFEQLKEILGALNMKAEPRTFVNVYEDDEGRYISDKDSSSYKEAYDGRDNIKAYLETVEIIRHKKP